MFYAGDGVSDLSAAKETDLLFAKKGHGNLLPPKPLPRSKEVLTVIDLIKWCVREKVPFTQFEDWSTILSTVKDIVEGKTTVKEVSAAGLDFTLSEEKK